MPDLRRLFRHQLWGTFMGTVVQMEPARATRDIAAPAAKIDGVALRIVVETTTVVGYNQADGNVAVAMAIATVAVELRNKRNERNKRITITARKPRLAITPRNSEHAITLSPPPGPNSPRSFSGDMPPFSDTLPRAGGNRHDSALVHNQTISSMNGTHTNHSGISAALQPCEAIRA